MSLQPPVSLRVWESDFGVPSVDPDSLVVLTLFKIYRVNMKVNCATLPQWQEIPSLQYGNLSISEPSDVFLHAMTICKADATLDVIQSSQAVVYKNYFKEYFIEAFLIDCWIVDVNYEHAIKTWYNNAMSFPFSYMFLKKKRQEALERFNNMLGQDDREKFILKCYEKACRCLEDFNNMLNDERGFLLGPNPCYLDAYVYSHLAIAINMPLPDPTLQNAIKDYNNLTRYVRNMTQRFFPHVTPKLKYVEPVNASNERASTKSLVIAAVCASSAMLFYAYFNGLLKLPRFS